MKLNDERIDEPTVPELLVPGLVRVPLKTDTLLPATRTNAFLVDVGERWLIVDPGSSRDSELDALFAAIAEHVPSGSELSVFLTHHHADHLRGAAAVARANNCAVIGGHRAIEAARNHAEGIGEVRVLTEVQERIGNARAIRTEGHAPGHYALLTEAGHLVAGDLVSGMGTIIVAPPDGDMLAYYASLERAMSLGAVAVHPAHGPSSSPASERLRAYLEHRRAREQRLMRALVNQGGGTEQTLLAETYSDVPDALHPLALGTLRAYLVKLEAEHVVRRTGDRYRLA